MDRYNHYNNITEAETACNLDYGCQAYYQNECNKTLSDVYLCPMGTTYRYSESSCIYEKGKIWCCAAKVEAKNIKKKSPVKPI